MNAACAVATDGAHERRGTLRIAAGAAIRDPSGLRRDLERLLGSTAFEIDPELTRLRLRGADTRYHALDPELAATVRGWGLHDPGAIATYRRETPHFALCLEDFWTGWFLADCLSRWSAVEPLVLLHLDDHADMMPTLLQEAPHGHVRIPGADATFDAASPSDWEAAIALGAVTIGNHLTPLVHHAAGRAGVHVRHLRPSPDPDWAGVPRGMRPVFRSYDLVPGPGFAAVEPVRGDSNVTYLETADTRAWLSDLPRGSVIVHIDLDYFLNDFNGNPGSMPISLTNADRRMVTCRMTRAFAALTETRRPVERWIIATSPGFCAARHWDWLLSELAPRIRAHDRRVVDDSGGT